MEKAEIIHAVVELWYYIIFGAVLGFALIITDALINKNNNKRQSKKEQIQKALDEEHLEKYGWTKESRTYVCPEE